MKSYRWCQAWTKLLGLNSSKSQTSFLWVFATRSRKSLTNPRCHFRMNIYLSAKMPIWSLQVAFWAKNWVNWSIVQIWLKLQKSCTEESMAISTRFLKRMKSKVDQLRMPFCKKNSMKTHRKLNFKQLMIFCQTLCQEWMLKYRQCYRSMQRRYRKVLLIKTNKTKPKLTDMTLFLDLTNLRPHLTFLQFRFSITQVRLVPLLSQFWMKQSRANKAN